MNGATEQTLQDLLKQAEIQNANLVKLQSLISAARSSSGGLGGGSSGGISAASAALGPLGIAANLAVNAISGLANIISNVVAGAFEMLGSIVGKVVTGFVNTAANLVIFAQKAMEGTAKLSDLIKAFGDLPFFIGTVANVLGTMVGMIEKTLVNWKDLTTVGISFSGSLSEMRNAATRAHLSLGDFVDVMKANSQILSTMPGGISAGVKKFTDIQAKLAQPGSTYYEAMTGLGLTAKESAEMLGLYMRAQGTLQKKGLENNDKVAASVVNLTTELDLYAKLTGTSVQAMKEKMAAAALDDNFQSFFDNLDPDTAASYQLALAEASEKGVGALQNLKQALMSGGEVTALTTKEQRAAYVNSNGALEEYTRLAYEAATKFKIGSDGYRSKMDEANLALAKGTGKFNDEVGKATRAILVTQGSQYGTTAELNKNLNQLKGKELKDLEARRAEAKAEQEAQKAANAEAKSMLDAKKRIDEFGNQLSNRLISIIAPMIPMLSGMATQILNAMTSLVGGEGFMSALWNVTEWLSDTFKKLSEAENFEDFLATVGEVTVDLITNLIDKIVTVFDSEKPAMQAAWKRLGDSWDKLMDKLEPYFSSFLNKVGEKLGLTIGQTAEQKQQQANQDQLNKKNASWGERISMLPAEAVESIAGIFSDTLKEQAVGARVRSDSEYLKKEGRFTEASLPKAPNAKRHSGTWGMTGDLFEKKDATLDVAAGESVMTSNQIQAMITAAIAAQNNNIAAALDRLNNNYAQGLVYQQQTAEYTKKTANSTKSMSGNLFS